MASSTFRPHRRFAVRQKVHIAHNSGLNAEGLLIELSMRGCRISNMGTPSFTSGDAVMLEIDGFDPIHATVRLADDRVLCLNFKQPLYTQALSHLVSQCRPAMPAPRPLAASAHA